MNSHIQLMLQQAIQSFQSRNFDSAELMLKRILQIDSKNLPALYIFGLIKASQSKYREAVNYLAKAARIQPNDALLQYNLAKALTDLGNDKEALPHHKKAVTLAPNNAEAWINYGLSMFNLDHYDEALAHYDKALSLNPDYSEAWFIKGNIFGKLKFFDEAIAHYDKALSLMPEFAEAWSNKGVILNELKRYDEAIAHYDKALSLKPDFAEAWANKGISLKELKRFDEALAHYDRALSLKSDYDKVWFTKGNMLSEFKRFDEALDHYDKVLTLKPNYAKAWCKKGSILSELKRYDEAIAHYDTALDLQPDYAEAWSNKGAILNVLKCYDEAIAHCDKALSLKPDYAEAWANKGNALIELERYDEAISHYDKALTLKPDYAEVWSNKGDVLNELKHFDEALAHYDKALKLQPDIVEALSNKGNVFAKLQRFDEAMAHYDKALSLMPEFAEAWSNKGVILSELKRYEEAIVHYDKAISLKPDYAEAWANKGDALNQLRRYDEAITHCDKALSLKPDIYWAYGLFVHIKMKICSWSGLADLLEIVTKKVLLDKKVVQPFVSLSLNDNANFHKKSSEIFSQFRAPTETSLGDISKLTKKEKIRIAYFSPDFKNHPVSFLTAELFEIHNRDKFEVFAFSLQLAPVGDETNLRLRRGFDKFFDVGNMSDREIAQFARECEVDIAVDLGGHTAGARTNIFAFRAAPIQVSYLGYLGTMGAEYIDYIFADNTTIPVFLQKFYTEKIVYLPSYQVNDRKRHISDKQFTRAELALPETGFIFCCFSNNYKVLPATFDGWMRILKAVDGSILFLYAENEWVEKNLKNEAMARGVDGAKLVFGKRIPTDEYLARYKACGLFLDTFPYNAGTTASDALWAGLPILTLMGQSFASRMAASILNAIGLPELIANTQVEYEALAIELALNPKKLADIKLRLVNNRLTTPLFDTPFFTKNIEAAYIKMIDRYHADLEPDHIAIV